MCQWRRGTIWCWLADLQFDNQLCKCFMMDEMHSGFMKNTECKHVCKKTAQANEAGFFQCYGLFGTNFSNWWYCLSTAAQWEDVDLEKQTGILLLNASLYLLNSSCWGPEAAIEWDVFRVSSDRRNDHSNPILSWITSPVRGSKYAHVGVKPFVTKKKNINDNGAVIVPPNRESCPLISNLSLPAPEQLMSLLISSYNLLEHARKHSQALSGPACICLFKPSVAT